MTNISVTANLYQAISRDEERADVYTALSSSHNLFFLEGKFFKR